MFKILIFAKRKPGLTREQFIDRYENVHIPLTVKLVEEGKIPPLISYKRNFIDHDHPLNIGSVPYDVVTEACYADRAGFENNRSGLTDPEVAELVGRDMSELLDLTDVQYIVVDEFTGGGGAPN